MRILVTGGSGRLGTAVISELLAHDHEPVNADRTAPRPGGPSVRFIETHLGDVGEVAGAMHGCDAVIHLGAIPSPYRHADEVVFGNNTDATFAVLQAAHLLGVRKAAIASSASAYGMAWTPKPFSPAYAPIDEEMPMRNHDPYGLSKEVDEATAHMFHRRNGIQIAALRFHYIAVPEEYGRFPDVAPVVPGADSGGLWGYIDVRDAARACRLAIEAESFGFEAFNIMATDTLRAEPTEELIRTYLPETELRAPLPGNTGGWSIAKAARLLGWKPQYSWRDQK